MHNRVIFLKKEKSPPFFIFEECNVSFLMAQSSPTDACRQFFMRCTVPSCRLCPFRPPSVGKAGQAATTGGCCRGDADASKVFALPLLSPPPSSPPSLPQQSASGAAMATMFPYLCPFFRACCS